MCLIIEQPAGDHLSKDEVADIFGRNQDGFGVMWIDPETGKVQTWQYLPRTAAQAYALYKPFAGFHCVLHWRMCTHGLVSLDNTHPFQVGENQHVVHNGVLSGLGYGDKSDTVHMVESVLRPWVGGRPELLKDRAVRWTLEKAIAGSVLVFADVNGFTWLGRDGLKFANHGVVPGRLYSNTYAWSAPRPAHVTYNGTYGQWRGNAGWYGDNDDKTPPHGVIVVPPTRTVHSLGTANSPSQKDLDVQAEVEWSEFCRREKAKRDANAAFGGADDGTDLDAILDDHQTARSTSGVPWAEFDRCMTLVDGDLVDLAEWLAVQVADIDRGLSWELANAADSGLDEAQLLWGCDQAIDYLQARCTDGYSLVRDADVLICTNDPDVIAQADYSSLHGDGPDESDEAQEVMSFLDADPSGE